MLHKTLDQWLTEYGESHQHPHNKIIHWICVPAILWSVLALLWLLQLPQLPWINGATLLILISILFYARLSLSITLGMLIISSLSLYLIHAYESSNAPLPLWQFALLIFVIAWIGQFIGHKIEGKKPSFFQDLQFLLVGPAWLLSFVYRKMGIPLVCREGTR